MNQSSSLAKVAALASSVVLVAAFVATRCQFFEYRRPPPIEQTSTDSKVLSEVRPLGLEFQLATESGPNFYLAADSNSDHSRNDDWIMRVDHSLRDPALIEVSAEELRSWAEEVRARVPEKTPSLIMSGSKSIVINWNPNRNTSEPLVAGGTSLATMMESKVKIVDWDPITMFACDADPVVSMLNTEITSTLNDPTAAAISQLTRAYP